MQHVVCHMVHRYSSSALTDRVQIAIILVLNIDFTHVIRLFKVPTSI